jgi:hypothetical protein
MVIAMMMVMMVMSVLSVGFVMVWFSCEEPLIDFAKIYHVDMTSGRNYIDLGRSTFKDLYTFSAMTRILSETVPQKTYPKSFPFSNRTPALKRHEQHEPISHRNHNQESKNTRRNTPSNKVFDLQISLPSLAIFHHNRS